MGLHRAWPEAEIVGVDIKPQPRYPFMFVLGDAMTFPLEGFDFVWASPPCQHYTALKTMWNAKSHPDLIDATRNKLLGIAHCIENVQGAPLNNPLMLCGSMFNLHSLDGGYELRRHRLFETSWKIVSPGRCAHNGPVLGVYGGHSRDRRRTIKGLSHAGGGYRNNVGQRVSFPAQLRREVMGIDWMNGTELSQAIPPAYSEYIANQFSISSTIK